MAVPTVPQRPGHEGIHAPVSTVRAEGVTIMTCQHKKARALKVTCHGKKLLECVRCGLLAWGRPS